MARVIAVALFALSVMASSAFADTPPPGSTWSEHYINEADGTILHADVLRPSNLPANAKTPVILSIGPYFNHSGQLGPIGVVDNADYTPTADGPSSRFYDFVNGAQVMKRGYTYVMVDLRGFGGSRGCLDWAGPGEQADVVAAVQWAAAQSWSSGKVGMYGKSYDGVTGLIGAVLKPQGLAAVVSQEPVYDLYRYLYMNRVRFINSLETPALYDAIAANPGSTADELAYQMHDVNDRSRPGCPALNWADQQDPNHSSPYWLERDFIGKAKGTSIPVFLTQGFIENNTKPDGAYDFYNNLKGPKRAWLGMWDHVRGNDTDTSGRLAMGRASWFAEVMRWYDYYLKGSGPAPTSVDPPVVVESSDGKWRGEKSWPPADSRKYTAALHPGTYTDDTLNNGTSEGDPLNGTGVKGDGIWTFSPAFTHEVRFAGVPRLTVNQVSTLQNANLTADIYDLDSANSATLISRGAYLLGGTGTISFDMYGDDWVLPAGHRLGVLISSSNAEWWLPTPTFQTVTVRSASVTLPFLSCKRTSTIQGNPSIKLEDYKASTPFDVDAATVTAATDPKFPVPPALSNCTP